jgi:nucleoside-diphosphate-sugar epimerase
VTGACGFIGSTLAERLVNDGWDVVGIDSLTPYYDADQKRRNVSRLLHHPAFTFIEADLLQADLGEMLDGADIVYHQAAQPGVRLSWSSGFRIYADANIVATQRLLEAAQAASVGRFIYASSSSVYGNAEVVPTPEDAPKRPFSPYGVTKYAGEMLCRAYGENFGLFTLSLRYFTVYGPRQRPDMAIHRMIESARMQTPFTVFGDGSQVRDFTFVGDVVEANVRAASAACDPGAVVNIAGGSSSTVSQLLDLVGEAVGQPVLAAWQAAQPGDVRATGGDISAARQLLGWSPGVSLPAGIAAQVEWHRGQ